MISSIVATCTNQPVAFNVYLDTCRCPAGLRNKLQKKQTSKLLAVMLWLVSLLIELSIGQVNHSLPLYAYVSRLVPLHAPSTTACSHLFTLINVFSIYACAHAHIHQLVHIIISNIVTSPSLSGKTVLDLFTFIL